VKDPPRRTTADLSEYPELVVIYLGMRADEPRGAKTVEELAPQIQASVDDEPDGLLLHEEVVFPNDDAPHYGMRQYWRDFDSLEAWARSLPHKAWWTDYLRDRGGTSFWHETYFRKGGIETAFVDVDGSIGLNRFAPMVRSEGPMFSARLRVEKDRAQASSG
jgi:fumigallin biosynthesis monooxygenase-like protein